MYFGEGGTELPDLIFLLDAIGKIPLLDHQQKGRVSDRFAGAEFLFHYFRNIMEELHKCISLSKRHLCYISLMLTKCHNYGKINASLRSL